MCFLLVIVTASAHCVSRVPHASANVHAFLVSSNHLLVNETDVFGKLIS